MLRLEQMEDRVVPANLELEVTTQNDVVDEHDSVLSLREAIIAANAALPTSSHIITFRSDLAGGTITLDPSKGQLTIEKNTIISAPSTGNVTIQRDSTSQTKHRIFEITQGANAELWRFNLRHGAVSVSSYGGAILVNGGELLISDCNLTNNSALHGGALAVKANSSLFVFDSTISSNSALEDGGGVYSEASSTAHVFIFNSTISSNESGVVGGGIAVRGGYTLLDDVEVSNNKSEFQGGGIYAYPTGTSASIVIQNHSHIHHNELVASNAALRKGGGIYLGDKHITFDTVTIANNSATTGDGLYRVLGTTAFAINLTYDDDEEFVEE